MIGRSGVAISEFSPEGDVDVGGARCGATTNREAIVVCGIDGLYLEVEKP